MNTNIEFCPKTVALTIKMKFNHALSLMSLALILGIVSAAEIVVDKRVVERLCQHDLTVPAIFDEKVVLAIIDLLESDKSIKCREDVAESIKRLRSVLENDKNYPPRKNPARRSFRNDYMIKQTVRGQRPFWRPIIVPPQLMQFFFHSQRMLQSNEDS